MRQGICVLPISKATELGIIPSESSHLRVLRWTTLGKTISWQQPGREKKVVGVEGRTKTLQNQKNYQEKIRTFPLPLNNKDICISNKNCRSSLFRGDLDGQEHHGCLASCLLMKMENQAWENSVPHRLSIQVFLGQREIGETPEHVEKEKLKS